MCIAIVQRPGAVLLEKQIEQGWRRNGDGAGFAFIRDGKVEIKKGFMNLEAFKKAYYDAVKEFGKDSPFLVHMRIRTSGLVDKHNTHPFPIKDGAMIHNGVLFTPTGKHAGDGKKSNSDTKVIASTLFNVLVKQDLITAQPEIEKVIGTWNKFAFLFNDGEFLIMNEDQGDWVDNIWYSNTSCRLPVPVSARGATTPTSK